MIIGQNNQRGIKVHVHVRGVAIGADHGSFDAKEMLKRYTRKCRI